MLFKFYIYYSTLFLTVKIAMKQKSRRNIPKTERVLYFSTLVFLKEGKVHLDYIDKVKI
jgi:hypothetical protein